MSLKVLQPFIPSIKKHLLLPTATLLCFGLNPASAHPGQPTGSTAIDSAMAKLFGVNTGFTATLESQLKPASGNTITMPGKIAFDTGKARFELKLAEANGLKMPPSAADQMKAMGLDPIVTIPLPEKKLLYLIYPGLQCYVEKPATA